jgi:hypothetical protein
MFIKIYNYLKKKIIILKKFVYKSLGKNLTKEDDDDEDYEEC